MALFASFATGCTSVLPLYKPTRVGVLPNATSAEGLVMKLRPDRTTAKFGDLLTFEIIIENLGSKAVWLPAEPEILLTWVYPDGKCDNFVGDEKPQAAPPALRPLAPGEERRFCARVATDYFSRRGITEFRARMRVPHAAQNAPDAAWVGEMASNGYGVMFAN